MTRGSRKLLLFDIDGTLLLDDAYAGGHAMERAAEQVYGVQLEPRAVARSKPFGTTDRRIAREILRSAGVDDHRIAAGMKDWMDAAADAFEEEAARTVDAWRVREGAEEALRALADAGHIVGVLSGNLERIARTKVSRMGLDHVIDPAQGAFGSEREARAELVPLARKRAATSIEPWPREDTLIIGDTPGDIGAAAADRVRAVVFASERFRGDALVGAAAVIDRFDELPGLF
jgi:phosphoglycolate phosphatase-like HAD superfamily hydrolase